MLIEIEEDRCKIAIELHGDATMVIDQLKAVAATIQTASNARACEMAKNRKRETA